VRAPRCSADNPEGAARGRRTALCREGEPKEEFDGGTIAAGDSLTRTRNVTVPRATAKALKEGEPAALFVTTRTDNGHLRSYIAAYYQPPVKKPQG
jgi:hypothetical protein